MCTRAEESRQCLWGRNSLSMRPSQDNGLGGGRWQLGLALLYAMAVSPSASFLVPPATSRSPALVGVVCARGNKCSSVRSILAPGFRTGPPALAAERKEAPAANRGHQGDTPYPTAKYDPAAGEIRRCDRVCAC